MRNKEKARELVELLVVSRQLGRYDVILDSLRMYQFKAYKRKFDCTKGIYEHNLKVLFSLIFSIFLFFLLISFFLSSSLLLSFYSVTSFFLLQSGDIICSSLTKISPNNFGIRAGCPRNDG